MSEPNEKKAQKERERFVRETITNSKNRGKRLAKRAVTVVLSALAFGVLAAFMFVITRPFWESHFGEPETSMPEPVIIFESTTAETSMEESTEVTTEEETSREEEQYAAQWEALKPSVESEINDRLRDVTGKDAFAQQRKAVAATVSKSIVTVSARNVTTDWFDNDLTHREEQGGVIVAITRREILVLTDADILTDNQQLYAVFANSLQMPATIRAVDRTFGLTVLAVNRHTWTEEQIQGVSAIQMANYQTVEQGQTVIAMGAPMGYTGSTLYGSVAYIEANAPGPDTSVRLLQTDIQAPDGANGFLVNLDGKLIGWITSDYPANTQKGFLSAIALPSLATTIERLSNGERLALLGILGQRITPTIAAEHELQEGIYISRCIADTPADKAGIQNGDILIAIDETPIHTFTELANCLQEHKPGDPVQVHVLRQGEGEYIELVLETELGTR